MALSKQQRQAIVDSLVNEIGKAEFSGSFSVDRFSASHGLSKQSIYRYLESLESESKIKKIKKGRKNTYHLESTTFQFKYTLANLSEDIIWSRDIKPLLNDMPEIAMRVCNYAFCEMLNNAIDHSEGTAVNITVLINACRAAFLLIDDGIGIFTKIASAMQLEEKRFAILELAKGKFTTDPGSHTGEGIFFSAKTSDGFGISSDDLVFTASSFLESEQLRDFKSPFQSGTVVAFIVFRDHSTPISEVFEKYTQDPDDYGFTKTVVPVRLLEHGDPNPTFVSRSQAKRLLARFDRFERIELDFSDVDEIGQGFADEIFRVFQTQHPNSQIVAVNCNKHIERMIKHVTRRKV